MKYKNLFYFTVLLLIEEKKYEFRRLLYVVCENDDLLFIGKTNSTDYAAQLRNLELQGNCNVIIGTYGFRIPLFSTYPNIAKIKLVEGNQETIINSEVVYV